MKLKRYMNVLVVAIVISICVVNATAKSEDTSNEKTCFYKLTGNVDDCDCKIDDIIRFNNYYLKPRLDELLRKDYFRYFKVNLNKICKFWQDDARCSIKDCLVKTCSEDDLPATFQRYLKEESFQDVLKNSDTNCEQSNPLGHLNETITDENLKTFETWKQYDDAQENFCEPDDEYLEKAKYVDLFANPERYTGYKGDHAHKIWNSIYGENCFKEAFKQKNYAANVPKSDTCLEKRVFYRLVSGLHASINIHLCSNFLHEGIFGQPDYWGPAPEEFRLRFDPKTTYNQGPQYLRNLYFVYLVELRALTKVAPYLEKQVFFTGNHQADEETKVLVSEVLDTIKKFQYTFDETKLFRENTKEAKKLKEEFKVKFRNITKIMDCVGCDKCRLWGKLQTTALGTALKIVFADPKHFTKEALDSSNTTKQSFQLTRPEIVALINGFARLSTSILEVERFKELLDENNRKEL